MYVLTIFILLSGLHPPSEAEDSSTSQPPPAPTLLDLKCTVCGKVLANPRTFQNHMKKMNGENNEATTSGQFKSVLFLYHNYIKFLI